MAKTESTPPSAARRALNAVRPWFLVAGGFSLVTNLLVMVSPLYSYQLFDRVLGSAHIETLVFLTLIAASMVAALLIGFLVTRSITAPLPWCSESTARSSPRASTLLSASALMTASGVAVGPEVTRAVAIASVGIGSFSEVRMNSGDPRYQPIITRSAAARIAAVRTTRERGMRGVSR